MAKPRTTDHSAKRNSPAKKRTSGARTGKKVVAGFFDPAVSRQLKEIGLAHDDMSVQDVLAEAINDFFVKYGKKPIA